MKCFWSGTDETTCRKIGQGDWFLSIVANKKRNMLARLDIYKPFRLTLDNIEIAVEDDIAFVIPQEIKDEIAEKVSTRYYNTNQNFGRNYYGDNHNSWDKEDWWNKNTKEKKDGSFKRGTRTIRWNKTTRTLEVFDVIKNEWVSEVESIRNDYQAELDVIAQCSDTPTPAKWDVDKVVINDGETFKPCNDGRKFGDVPPPEVFEYCKGADRNIPLCGSCAYKKECDLFFIGMS